MADRRGYYSLIQYCPDASRLEAANVGVLLFCPDPHYIRAKTIRSNDRVRRIFGPDYQIDTRHVNVLKQGIEDAIAIEGQYICTLGDLEAFIGGLANEVRITQPRPMRVTSPDEGLDELLRVLVPGDRGRRQGMHDGLKARRALREVLGEPELEGHIRRDMSVRVPAFHDEWLIPYAYQNGRLNLVRPVDFGKTKPLEKACQNAIAGESLWANPDPIAGERKLVVVASFDAEAQEHEGTILELLRGHQVTTYSVTDLGPLVADVRASASHLAIE